MVLAPEHPLVAALTTPEQQGRGRRLCRTGPQAERDRAAVDRQGEDRRVHWGLRGQPVHREEIPIYIADYVLVTYGTGAIMAVPGGDERDYDFARKYGLPIIPVVAPDGGDGAHRPGATRRPAPVFKADRDGPPLYTGPGRMINSGPLDGMPTAEAKRR